MWRNACLLLWLCSAVAVHGSEVECTKRIDVISKAAWASLREIDFNVLSITNLVNVASVRNSSQGGQSTHVAWYTADSKTYLQGSSSCFDTGHGTGPRELVELQRRAVKDIQFGDDFIVILATDGTVWTAGCNENGRLGHHGTETRPVLSQVMDLPPVKKIAVAAWNVIVIANNGELYSWGSPVALGYKSNDFVNQVPKKINLAQEGIMPKARDICCDFVHCVVVTEDFRAMSWGAEDFIGRPVPEENIPALVPGIPENQHISKVACGHVHTLAVTSSGRLFGWGYDNGGSLLNIGSALPYATELDMGGKIIRDVAAGRFTSLIVTDNGDSYYFGNYWRRSWYSPQPTVGDVVFPRDILATIQYYSYGEETDGAVSLGCK